MRNVWARHSVALTLSLFAVCSNAQNSDALTLTGINPADFVASKRYGIDENDKSRIIVIDLETTFPRGRAVKNDGGGRVKMNGEFRTKQIREIMPDRIMHIFVVAPRGAAVTAKNGAMDLIPVGNDLQVTVTATSATPKRLLTVRHFQGFAEDLYGTHTYTAVLPLPNPAPANAVPETRSFSATYQEAPQYDAATEIPAFVVARAGLPPAFGVRKSILPINRIAGNDFSSYMTLDAIVLYKDDEDSALGGAVSFNFSLGGRRRENLPGRFGFPVYLCVTAGFSGLDFSRVNSAGRPFIGIGISIPTSWK